MQKLWEQLLDLRLRTHPNNTKKKPELTDYFEVSVMLGEAKYKAGKLIYEMPDWDIMCERDKTCRYALAVTALTNRLGIEKPRHILFDFGYPMYSKILYDARPISDQVVQGQDTWTTVVRKAKVDTGSYNDVYIQSLYNPFYTWLEYYEKGILLDPKNILPRGYGGVDNRIVMQVENGWNPELDIMMDKPFDIVEEAKNESFDI